jgi:hypothetical protein
MIPASVMNKMHTPIQNDGDLAPVTFKLSILLTPSSSSFLLAFTIQLMKSNNDTSRATKSQRNVLITSQASMSSLVTAIPKLKCTFLLYVKELVLNNTVNTIFITKNTTDAISTTPMSIVQIVIVVDFFSIIIFTPR